MTDINTSSGESDERAAVLTAEQKKRIAGKVYGDCQSLPGANFYTAAEFAIAETLAALATQPATPAEVVEAGPGEFDPAERIRSWEQGLAAEARGIERAAQWVDTRRANFEGQHGIVDPETGTLEFGRGAHAEAKREYAGELAEIAEGLRDLMRCTVPTAGWTCSRVKGHSGPCAASFAALASPAQAPAAPSVGEPVAWMMKWPNHSPSFTTDKSDYVSWLHGQASYPDELIPLYATPPAAPAATEAPSEPEHGSFGWRLQDAQRVLDAPAPRGWVTQVVRRDFLQQLIDIARAAPTTAAAVGASVQPVPEGLSEASTTSRRKKLLCRLINDGLERGSISDDDAIFLATTSSAASEVKP